MHACAPYIYLANVHDTTVHSYIVSAASSTDLNQSAADEQFLASESLNGQACDDRRHDTQSVDADGERSGGARQTAIGQDLLKIGVDGDVSRHALRHHDHRHHQQPAANLPQHRQPLT